jgi:hypothetical protein|nr:hypothetical protein [Kofleriaceae bacterium]
MPRAFDLAKLLDNRPIWHGQPTPYRTWPAELAAIAARRKGCAYFTWGADYVTTREFRELVAEVRAHGLALVVDPDTRGSGYRVFVCHATESWRVPAMRALDEAMRDYGWSEAVEAARSAIIGYTTAQIRDWMAWIRRYDLGLGLTVYTVFDRARERASRRLGRRCLGDPASLVGTSLLVGHSPLKARAHARVPRGHRLARFALDSRWASDLFGRRPSITVTPAIAARINDAIRSDIQFLTARGWTR